MGSAARGLDQPAGRRGEDVGEIGERVGAEERRHGAGAGGLNTLRFRRGPQLYLDEFGSWYGAVAITRCHCDLHGAPVIYSIFSALMTFLADHALLLLGLGLFALLPICHLFIVSPKSVGRVLLAAAVGAMLLGSLPLIIASQGVSPDERTIPFALLMIGLPSGFGAIAAAALVAIIELTLLWSRNRPKH